ncbi:MAG: L-fucose isomerase [Bacillota bacterium]|nr:L-fucose isomerase [Bacillota bacterium]
MFELSAPRTAIITFEDSRELVYQRRHSLVMEELNKIRAALDGKVKLSLDVSIRQVGDIAKALAMPGLHQAESVILHVPTWVLPNVVVMTARQVQKPLAVITNERRDSAGLVGMLASAGGLDEVGLKHVRLIGDGLDPRIAGRLVRFCKAASVVNRLRGTTYGLLGGRSLGMYTATADPAQWQRDFGVDIEQVDQLEIVRRAEAIPADRVTSHVEWLTSRVGLVEYDDSRFTPAHLEKQVRCYIATKDLIAERRLDFAGLKCQTEMSDGYVLQCLSAALLNDPYDAEGGKTPTPVACEADCDGALTMMLLHLLTLGQPTALMDVKLFDRAAGLFSFSNCGGMATWFSNCSPVPEENLAQVHLRAHIFGEAGGGATQYVAAPGPVTLARMCRKNGRYWMAIVPGEAVTREREELRQVVWPWPHMFISTRMNLDEFFETFASNHMHVTKADVVDELKEICDLLGIEAKVY